MQMDSIEFMSFELKQHYQIWWHLDLSSYNDSNASIDCKISQGFRFLWVFKASYIVAVSFIG